METRLPLTLVWENAGGNTLLQDNAKKTEAERERFKDFKLPGPHQGDLASLMSTRLKDAASVWTVHTFGTRRLAEATLKGARKFYALERDGAWVSQWTLEPADVEWFLGDASLDELKAERYGATVNRSKRAGGGQWMVLAEPEDKAATLASEARLHTYEWACGQLKFPQAFRDALLAAPVGFDASGAVTLVSLRALDQDRPTTRRGGLWRLEGAPGARKLVPTFPEVELPFERRPGWQTLADWHGPAVADVVSRYVPQKRAFHRNRYPCGDDWRFVEAAGLRLLRFGERGRFHVVEDGALVEFPEGFDALASALARVPTGQREQGAVVTLFAALGLGEGVLTEAARDALGPPKTEAAPPPPSDGGPRVVVLGPRGPRTTYTTANGRAVTPVAAAALEQWHAPRREGDRLVFFAHHGETGFFRVTVKLDPPSVQAERLADPRREAFLKR